jgi:glutamate-1-semialdehyde 2,1-aminomutase
MRRFREESPADLCFARGTFNAHPYVMTAMNGMLQHLDRPEVEAQYANLDATWTARAETLNQRLAAAQVPVRVGAFTAVWTTLYTQPGRYHWMFQYYLRAEGLLPAWIGSGRFIFSHATNDAEFAEIADRFVAAARAMAADGWWWTDAALSTRNIRRTMLVELLRAKLGLRPVAATPPPEPALPAPESEAARGRSARL